jgi:transcriptional adapter 2-alpha
VQCFADGKSAVNHNPATHPYQVIEQNSVPIYDKNWGADEELLLLEGCEIYGLGSWADVADHIGGYRNKDEVAAHYEKIYLKSSKFPLPERASPNDMQLLNETPRDDFQATKKRRIEQRKEAAKNAPPATPKKKPTASVPSCHEVQGYMPGRLEFEAEYMNEAEEAVQHMQFEPGDGINPRTGELDPEMELKMTVMDIYNSRLTQRADRKKVMFEHNLLEYRKNAAADKKRTKEERDILNKAKPFARMMNSKDFEDLTQGLAEEHELRQAIGQLQNWREMKITSLEEGAVYEEKKGARAVKLNEKTGLFDRDRFASSQRSKPAPIIETPSGAAALVAPELPLRFRQTSILTPTPSALSSADKLTNGHTNGTSTPVQKEPFIIPPLAGVSPLKLSQDNAPDLQLLTDDEIELCEKVRLSPKAYIAMKASILQEAVRGNGALKKKQVKELLSRMDGARVGRVFEFFVASGWIAKA